MAGKPLQSRTTSIFTHALGERRNSPNTHIHHFVFGMILMPFTFISLYWRIWYGSVLAGVVMALVFSEIKKLLLMNWGE